MEEKIANIYRQGAGIHMHAGIVYLAIATILLVSAGGVIPSTIMCLLVVAGLATLRFDLTAREALFDPEALRSMVVLFALVLLWQGLGLFLRSPADPKAAPVMGSAFGIIMLLPILTAAAKRDARFWNQLLLVLFGLGCVAAIASLLRYSVLLGSARALSLDGVLRERLIPIGRASHQILGAGGLAASFFAGWALHGRVSPPQKRGIIAGLALIALTILLTQSRGPILGMGLALLAVWCIERFSASPFRFRIAFTLAFLCFLIPVGLIVMEPWIKALVCTGQVNLCRPSDRQDVWASVLELVSQRPWFGIGPTFRFSGGSVPHPHNGFLGLIFYFGLPMGLLFVGIVSLALKRTLEAPRSVERTFALLGIFFAASFMATDLSNPFAFLNTHYLYLWLPIFVGAVAGSLHRDSGAPRAQPAWVAG